MRLLRLLQSLSRTRRRLRRDCNEEGEDCFHDDVLGQHLEPQGGKMKRFVANLRELSERFDPRYVAFKRRIAAFRYPAVRLSDLLSATPEYGAGEAGIERTSVEEPRYIRITDIDENGELLPGLGVTAEIVEPRYFLQNGDLLFARSGATVGKCYLHDTERAACLCFYAGYMIRFRLSEKALPRYIFAFAQTSYYRDWVQAVQRSAGQPNINAQEYGNLPIPLPPREVQMRIAAELDAAYAEKRKADDKAAKLLASIDGIVLDALGMPPLPPPDTSLAARIFTVPARDVVEARMDAIANQGARWRFLKNVKSSAFPSQPLGFIVEISRMQTNNLNGTTYVGMENIDGVMGEYFPTEGKEEISSGVLFREGDILVPRLRPYLNKIWLASFDGVASTEFFPLVAHGISADFVAAFLRTRAVANILTMLMTGNTLPRVQMEDVLALPIPIPPKAIQEMIVAKVGAIRKEAKRLKSEALEALSAAKRRIEFEIIGDESSV